MNKKVWVIESDNDGVIKVCLDEITGRNILLDEYIKLLENNNTMEISVIISDLKSVLENNFIPEYLCLYTVDLVE